MLFHLNIRDSNMRKFNEAFSAIILISILFTSTTVYGKKDKYSRNQFNSKSTQKQYLVESLKKLKYYLLGYSIISFEQTYTKSTNDFLNEQTVFSNEFYKSKLLNIILHWLGTPYKLGGSTKKGIDCSNFVAQVVHNTFGINFPANAETQSRLFKPIDNIDELTFGDLLFFTGRNKRSKRIGHVGIYLGNGIFAHSSTGKGVIITHITEGYYSERFRFGGRLTTDIFNIVSN